MTREGYFIIFLKKFESEYRIEWEHLIYNKMDIQKHGSFLQFNSNGRKIGLSFYDPEAAGVAFDKISIKTQETEFRESRSRLPYSITNAANRLRNKQIRQQLSQSIPARPSIEVGPPQNLISLASSTSTLASNGVNNKAVESSSWQDRRTPHLDAIAFMLCLQYKIVNNKEYLYIYSKN